MAYSERLPHEPDVDTGDMFTVAQALYAAAKAVLSTCPDCGYERGGCVCYEGSDQWLADMRAGWQSRLDELYADPPALPPAHERKDAT